MDKIQNLPPIPEGYHAEWENNHLTLVENENSAPNDGEKQYIRALDTSLPITERVQSWEDVCTILGYDPVEVRLNHTEQGDGYTIEPDEIAYIQLKAIASVLNEGWKPQFTTDEYRWFPWFYLYTQKEIDKMDEEERSRVVLRSNNNANAYYDSSSATASYGSRLAFKSRDLAIYAGKTFLDIWADFAFRPKAKSAGDEK